MEEGHDVRRLKNMVGSFISNEEARDSVLRDIEELLKYKRMFKMVEEFQEAFEPKGYKPQLRYDLLKEELNEYLDASEIGDEVEVADALVDMMYILIGTINKAGIRTVFYSLFREVHESNMSKLGEDGKPLRNENGKVIKGPNYRRPDLAPILDRMKRRLKEAEK